MNVLPGSWSEVAARLAGLFGGGAGGDAIAWEWLHEAVAAVWGGSGDPADLPSIQRGVALQKASGALLALEGDDLAFMLGVRGYVAAVFARYFRGVVLNGPPWRLDPHELDRPTWEEWAASADFN